MKQESYAYKEKQSTIVQFSTIIQYYMGSVPYAYNQTQASVQSKYNYKEEQESNLLLVGLWHKL